MSSVGLQTVHCVQLSTLHARLGIQTHIVRPTPLTVWGACNRPSTHQHLRKQSELKPSDKLVGSVDWMLNRQTVAQIWDLFGRAEVDFFEM